MTKRFFSGGFEQHVQFDPEEDSDYAPKDFVDYAQCNVGYSYPSANVQWTNVGLGRMNFNFLNRFQELLSLDCLNSSRRHKTGDSSKLLMVFNFNK